MKACIAVIALCLSACTSVDVRRIPAAAKVEKICIRFNEEVNVEDLVSVVQDNLSSHGIQSVVFRNQAPAGCPVQMSYTADRWWDMATYLVDANISVWDNNVLLGSAHYHLTGHGGLSLMKWEGTKAKVGPTMDAMLKDYPSTGRPVLATSASN